MVSKNNAWKPQLDNECNLKGPYPEVVDLCSDAWLDVDSRWGPKIIISRDECVKKILVPSDRIGLSYIDIRQLSSLEEIVIDGGLMTLGECLQWVTIYDCRSLKKLTIKGDVVYLRVLKTSLEILDIGGCKKIDSLAVDKAQPLLGINAKGCIKLREVRGCSGEVALRNGILEQIADNQKSSKNDDRIYQDMTFSDIDRISDLINDGVKSLALLGKIAKEDCGHIFGCYGLRSLDKNFRPYEYRVLDPLWRTINRGSGETYSYGVRDGSCDRDVFDQGLVGCKSPEDCLRYMLHQIQVMADYSSEMKSMTDNDLLAYLRNQKNFVEASEVYGCPIRLSEFIDDKIKAELERLISESGLKFAGNEVRDFVCVTSESSQFKEDAAFLDGAKITLDASEAMEQLKEIWLWRFKGKTIHLAGKLGLGKRKKELASRIEIAGFKLVEEVREGLAFLAHEDPESTNKKVVRAKNLGVKIISEEELLRLLKSGSVHD